MLQRNPSMLEETTTGARKRLERLIELERLLAADAKRVVRVVPSSNILDGLGSVLMHSQGNASTYDLSKPAKVIPCFVSHSWATGRWDKTMALAYYFHKWHAIALSTALLLLSISFVSMTARPGLCMPPWEFGAWKSDVMRAALIPLLPGAAFLAATFYAHTLPGVSTDCFLDKVCIHQTNPALKKQAIDSLDLFLRFSRRMLVLWSPEYLTRLWCTYELATFIKLHPDSTMRIDIMPSWLPKYTLFMFVYCSVAMTVLPLLASGPGFAYAAAVMGGGYVGYISILSATLLLIVIPGTVFFYLKVAQHTQMLAQLRDFRVADALCGNPRDVEFVHGLIEVMWSSSREANDGRERFEHFIRFELASKLEANFGPRTRLPYLASLISNLPVIAVCPMLALVCDAHMLELWGYMRPDGTPDLRSWAQRWSLYGLELWCFVNPVAVVATQEALAWCIDARRGAAACIVIGSLAYWMAMMPLIFLIVASVMYQPLQIGASHTLGGALLLGLLTLACFPPERLRRLLGLDTGGRKSRDGTTLRSLKEH